MLTTKLVNLKLFRPCACILSQTNFKRQYCKSKESSDNLGNMGSKYKVFKDEDSEIIMDVYEDRLKYAQLEEERIPDPLEGINLERGIQGVFDIEDLVKVLHRENAQDIFVAAVSPELKYVDYMCIVTGKSVRHMKAMAQFVKTVYKQKRNKFDLIPKLEGETSKDWMAMDLGNIALHIFSFDARRKYDLDSLWAVGPEFDAEYNKKDPIAEMLERHSVYLHDLQPAIPK